MWWQVITGQCKTKTVDCRLWTVDCKPGAKCRLRLLQTRDKMQTADYRLLSLHVCGVITIINYFSSIVMKVSVLRLAWISLRMTQLMLRLYLNDGSVNTIQLKKSAVLLLWRGDCCRLCILHWPAITCRLWTIWCNIYKWLL